MIMNVDERSATAWVVRCLTQTYDNTQGLYNAVTEAAHDAVRQYGREDFASMLSGADEGAARPAYVSNVGHAVVDIIESHLAEVLTDVPEAFRIMLADMVDLGSNETAWQLGEHYMPESVDDVEWEDER